MAQLIPVAAVASTVLSAGSKIAQGKAAKKSAYYEAAQLDRKAGATLASSQRSAIEQRRQADLLQSAALARAAASGAGASDPTVVDVMSDIEGEGEYRALADLYSGKEEASGLKAQAEATRYQGRQAKKAGVIGAASTVLDGANSFFEKYG